MESFLTFTLFYILCSLLFVTEPAVFVSLGLTIESIFSFYLKNETDSFICYHIRRTVATLLTHSSLPLVYVLVSWYMFPDLPWKDNYLWKWFSTGTLLPPSICACIVASWSRMNWREHPIVKKLEKFVTEDSNLDQIASDIDNEFRSLFNVIIAISGVIKVVVTDSWLIRVKPYTMDIAHQSDAFLRVNASALILNGGQQLSIEVKSTRPNVDPFNIWIKSTDFNYIKNKLTRPISIMGDIVILQSLLDRFLEEFKRIVSDNPRFIFEQELDCCLGCLQTESIVKLVTSCGDVSGPEKCTACNCKPQWCLDCMGKWFASRQNQARPNSWLSSKCTCPICRKTFCVLDVCLVERRADAPDASTTNRPRDDDRLR